MRIRRRKLRTKLHKQIHFDRLIYQRVGRATQPQPHCLFGKTGEQTDIRIKMKEREKIGKGRMCWLCIRSLTLIWPVSSRSHHAERFPCVVVVTIVLKLMLTPCLIEYSQPNSCVIVNKVGVEKNDQIGKQKRRRATSENDFPSTTHTHTPMLNHSKSPVKNDLKKQFVNMQRRN